MNAKEFALKIEAAGIIDYKSDDEEVRSRDRSPFDWIATGGPEVYEWVKLKIECGATDLTKEEFNEWILWYFESEGIFKKVTKEQAMKKAQEGGYLF
jgi:hypothetical protein